MSIIVNKNSKVLDLGCKKGFLLKDLNTLVPGIKSYGIENHSYPLTKIKDSKSKIIINNYYDLPFKNKYFDFVIAFIILDFPTLDLPTKQQSLTVLIFLISL